MAVGAPGFAGTGVEKAEEVVDFRGGGDRRTRVARGVLLLNGDRGRKALDFVDVGLFHALQELPGVGRETFHVAALALGINGVEDERGFARAGDTRDDGEDVMGNREGDILEIVDASAAEVDGRQLRPRGFRFFFRDVWIIATA